jgi:hypothetical protein
MRWLLVTGVLGLGFAVGVACNDVVGSYPALEQGGRGVGEGASNGPPANMGGGEPVDAPPAQTDAPGIEHFDGGGEHFDGGTGLFDAAGGPGSAVATGVYDSDDAPAR